MVCWARGTCYQEVKSASIPVATSEDGLARVKVIAGEALGARAVIATHTPVTYQDWTLRPGADVSLPLSGDLSVLVYVFLGAARVGPGARLVREGQLALLGPGETVQLRGGDVPGRLLLLAGKPHGEPVMHHGPFVMNTEEELVQAILDYQSGRMGEITRTARHG